MASSPPRPPQPTRFAVQFAKGKGWKTMYVQESREAATFAFHEAIKVKPKGFFRLVRLDPNSRDGTDLDFTWKLLALHDPRKGGITVFEDDGSQILTPAPMASGGVAAARPVASAVRPRPRSGHREKERVGIPLSVYALMLVLGAVVAVTLYLVLGGAGAGH